MPDGCCGRALAGLSFEQILKAYYTGVTICIAAQRTEYDEIYCRSSYPFEVFPYYQQSAVRRCLIFGEGKRESVWWEQSDAVHPAWLDELRQNLQPASEGLYTLKKKLCLPDADMYGPPVSFILTTEISCIYKKDGRVRKVHNLILAPDFRTMEKIQAKLSAIGNIRSDGRPILGLDSRDLLEIVLEANPSAFIIPAHIWTPWFSALGSKSGFDSIEECYGDLASHIFAVETGLSSDPPMNWRCSFLNRFSLVSNSDAHSPENLGREANLFDTDLSYTAIMNSLMGKDKGFTGTIEYFPEEASITSMVTGNAI